MKAHLEIDNPDRLLVRSIILVFILISVLSALVITLFQLGRARPARAGTLCVKPGGGGGCEASISEALSLAEEGDVILVAAGTYTENVLISQTITLQGGWAPDFSLRDLESFSSTIKPADNTQSVVSIQGQFADTGAVAPTLDGFIITGGRADLGSNHGGGLRIIDSDALVISNTIRDNRAFLLGGGVWVQRGAPILQSNQIMDNQSLGLGQEARGGGVQLENSGAKLISNTIALNLASGVSAYGGGVDIIGTAGSGVSLVGNMVRINTADGEPPAHFFGGGISIAAGASGQVALIGNQLIENNASPDPDDIGFGGAIAVSSGQVRLEDSIVFSNTASSGGGIYIGGDFEDCCNLTGKYNLVQENKAVTNGGGFLISAGGFFSLTNSTTIANFAGQDGGGVYSMGSTSLQGGLMISNTATTNGGGILIGAGGNFSITNSTIIANIAGQDGGGFYNLGSTLLRGGLVISNTATANGGGVLIGAGGNFSITNSATIANLAGGDGGAIHNSGLISVSNTTVSGNSAAGMGGGIANFEVVDLVNATVSDNTSADGAGFFNANMVNTVNSLIALNIGDNCLGVLNSLGNNLEDGGTCALGQPSDMSNTLPSMDSLGDNGGQTPTHALNGDSPAIDAGNNTACAALDQRGIPRPLDGDADGVRICDIGAFEYQIASTTAILSDEPDPSEPGEPFTVTFSVSATLGTPSGAVTVSVSGDPGTCNATLASGMGSCALSLSVPGTYTLTADYVSDEGKFAPSSATTNHLVETSGFELYLPVITRH